MTEDTGPAMLLFNKVKEAIKTVVAGAIGGVASAFVFQQYSGVQGGLISGVGVLVLVVVVALLFTIFGLIEQSVTNSSSSPHEHSGAGSGDPEEAEE